MKFSELQLKKRGIVSAVLVGTFLAAGPFLFWRIFLQQLPLTGSGSATLSDRFEEPDETVPETPAPERGAQLRELLAFPANSLTMDSSAGVLRMYEEGTGRAFEVHLTTLQATTLSESHLDAFHSTHWSPNGIEVISLFQEKSGSRYRYYNYSTSRVAELPVNIRNIAFSRNGNRIVTTRDTQDGTQLWISNPDGTNGWVFVATRLNIQQLFWPRDDMVVVRTMRADGNEDLVMFDMEKRMSLLLESYDDLDVLWDFHSSRALISYIDKDHGLVLSILDTITRDIHILPITTRASKCAWASGSSVITCGIPSQSTSASRDTITSLNMDTGELTVRYRVPEDVWVGLQEPVMVPRGNGIAFINTFDKRPYLLTW